MGACGRGGMIPQRAAAAASTCCHAAARARRSASALASDPAQALLPGSWRCGSAGGGCAGAACCIQPPAVAGGGGRGAAPPASAAAGHGVARSWNGALSAAPLGRQEKAKGTRKTTVMTHSMTTMVRSNMAAAARRGQGEGFRRRTTLRCAHKAAQAHMQQRQLHGLGQHFRVHRAARMQNTAGRRRSDGGTGSKAVERTVEDEQHPEQRQDGAEHPHQHNAGVDGV